MSKRSTGVIVSAAFLAWAAGHAVAQPGKTIGQGPGGNPPVLPAGVTFKPFMPGGVPQSNDAPITVCFAEDTTAEYMAEWSQIIADYNAQFGRYYLGTRWSGGQGTNRVVTWSFVPDGLVADGEASSMFADMDAKFAAQGGRATWIARVQACFDRWEELGGVDFTRITSGGNDWDDGASFGSSGSASRGDIRLAMTSIDGAGGVLAYAYYPSNGNSVWDEDEDWGSSTNQNRFFRNTVMHEMGHAIGFAHVCSSNSNILMEPILSTSFDGPRHDDQRALQRHYGDKNEGTSGTTDNSAAGAFNLGNLASGGTIQVGLPVPTPDTGTNDTELSLRSLDANGESDWVKFTTTSSGTVTFTLDPMGKTYNDNSQATNGSCNTGTSTNSANIADLAMDVYAADGTTLLATASAGGLGVTETISNLSLAAGTYHVRVYEIDAPAQSQLYSLTLTASSCSNPNITDQPDAATVCEGGSTTFTVVASGATSYQWRKNGSNISGATSTSYTINPVLITSGGTYDVVCTNSCGSVTSSGATLTVNALPVTPSSATTDRNNICPSDGSIILTAAGGSGSTLRWFSGSCGGTVLGTGNNLVVPAPATTTTYFARWENSCGVSTCTSTTLTVDTTVATAPSAANVDRPTINCTDTGNITLSVTGGSGTTLEWFDDACGGNLIGTGSPLVLPIPTTTTTYYARWTTQCTDSACESVTVDVADDCVIDWNHDCTVDAFDYDDFSSDYFNHINNGIGFPDYNNDGYVDAFDYDDFVSDFFNGIC